MQLKKLIIKGFKSFPEKTIMEFDEGITAVVGPNGSGKSNIIEAIRWVMGEQSAKNLRGNRMNDVIFSGTSERKPLNIAEVELVLDNSDNYLDIAYEEVSVLRRISRSGESTYMINQQECRLKDIVDLFMDSGLGKESFSVISQGQVEAIFNSKPEDRRGIFEEAAGVYKYKTRKKDAEKRLEETQENLNRIQDILYELESQLEPLRQQSDTAQTYLDQKEKLTDLDIGVTVWHIKDLKEKIIENTQVRDEFAKELTANEKTIQNIEAKQNEQADRLQTIENQRDQLNQNLVEIVREKERAEAALNLYDEKARHREEFIREKEMAIKNINNRSQLLKDEYDEVQTAYSLKSDQLKKLADEIAELNDKIKYLEGDKETHIEDLRNQYIDLLQEQTSLKNEKKYIEQEINRNDKDVEKSNQRVADLTHNKEQVHADWVEKQNEYDQARQALLSLLQEYKKIEQELNKIREDNHLKSQRISKVVNELERAKAKKSSLEDMQENYTGYYAGVRAVMQAQDQLEGIVGTVAESIKIPEEYVQAIDTVLASSSQFIIVEDEKSGREGINFLKRTKKGRATFLPLTTIQSRSISKNIQNQISPIPGFIGIASELVQNDSTIQNIIDNLLGLTLVADTLESANNIARAINFRNRVVTLEGDIINAGGSMTGGGGRQNHTSPIFTQKNELQDAISFIDENQQLLEQLGGIYEKSVGKQKKYEHKMTDLKELGEEKRLEEQNLKNVVENLASQLERLTRELKATSFEASETQTVHDSYQSQLENVQTSLEDINHQVTESKNRMTLLTSEKENIEEEKNKIFAQLDGTRSAYNDIREEVASIRANREHLSKQLEENKLQIETIDDDIKSFDQEIEDVSKDKLQEMLVSSNQKQIEVEKNRTLNREKYLDASQLSKQLTDKLNKLARRNKYVNDEKSQLDVRISRKDVKMDHYLDYLVEEYKISFEEAKLLNHPDISLEEAQKQVKLLKQGIEKLGPINLNAIEEYKISEERYSFLSQQQNDLIEAKANLF